MGKKVEKVQADFHKFLALLGLMTEHYGNRHRSKMLTKRPLPRVSGARAARPPIRPGMGGARAKSQRKRPLRVLNRSTGAPGVEDVSTPPNSNRARRRTQKEVHGVVRTRPTSARLTMATKTPRVMTSRAESVQAHARHCRARKTTTHGRREDTACDRGSFRAAYWHAEHETARASMENQSPSSLQHYKQTASDGKRGCAPKNGPSTSVRRCRRDGACRIV